MSKICALGIMQGRLLPKYSGRYQAHPVGYWQDEFPLAKEIGLQSIEFIADANDWEQNPLTSSPGIKQLREISAKHNVAIYSICADSFMETPLHKDDASSQIARERLTTLIKASPQIGCQCIVIPCVDQSSIKTNEEKQKLANVLNDFVPLCQQNDIMLALESDWNPKEFGNFMERVDTSVIKVNYDIGNSASLGYDPKEEFVAYGSLIWDVHIKDRILGGGSVFLGSGNANFREVFGLLEKMNYDGLFVMQAFRDDQGINIFKQQKEFITQYLKPWTTLGLKA
ncbi:MAG: sugar phosphate isomerase/epimerase family protein [Oligoflexales bacterium]